jgi:RND family efflux transporter MFP subunit
MIEPSTRCTLRQLGRHAHGAALCALLAMTAGCGGSATPTNTGAAGAAAQPTSRVSVVKPQRKTLRRVVVRPAEILAFDEARLFAKIPAYVESYLADIGDRVKGPRFDGQHKLVEKGQMLAQLSAPELDQDLLEKRALVDQASASVEQAQATIRVAEADAASAKARLAEATAAVHRVEAEFARWTSEYYRVVQLVSKSAVTQKLADETKAQLLAAEAARSEAGAKVESARAAAVGAEAQVDKSKADEAVARARREVAEAQLARAAALVEYLTIEAPFDGTISERHAEIGAFAHAGGTAQARPLFTVVRTDIVRVFVDLPESDAPWANAGDVAMVRVPSLAGREFKGAVTRTSGALDPATRTLRTEIDVPNADGPLRPGMYAQVTLQLDERADVWVVPAAAVATLENGTCSFAVENGKAIRKPVVPGLQAGGEIEIASGLTGSERLVLLGKGASLTDGQAVETEEAGATK